MAGLLGVVGVIAIVVFFASASDDDGVTVAQDQRSSEESTEQDVGAAASARSTNGGFIYTFDDVSWDGMVDGFLTWDEADGTCVAVIGSLTPTSIDKISGVTDGVGFLFFDLVYDEGNLESAVFSRCNEGWLEDAGYNITTAAKVEVGETFRFYEVFEQPDHVGGPPHGIQLRGLRELGPLKDAVKLETLPGTNQPPGPELKVIRQFSVDDMIDEDAILGVDLDLHGMALYDLIVPSGRHLNLYGQVLGDLLVEEGGSAEIYGVVSGTVSAQGSVTVHGEAYRAEGPGLVVAAGGEVQLRG